MRFIAVIYMYELCETRFALGCDSGLAIWIYLMFVPERLEVQEIDDPLVGTSTHLLKISRKYLRPSDLGILDSCVSLLNRTVFLRPSYLTDLRLVETVGNRRNMGH